MNEQPAPKTYAEESPKRPITNEKMMALRTHHFFNCADRAFGALFCLDLPKSATTQANATSSGFGFPVPIRSIWNHFSP